MTSDYQTIKKLLTSNTLPSYDVFFQILNEASECLENEKTDYRVKDSIVVLGMVGGGISVKLCLRQGRSGNSCTIAIVLATAAIEVE